MKNILSFALFGYEWGFWQEALLIFLMVAVVLLIIFIPVFLVLKEKRKSKVQEYREASEYKHKTNAILAVSEAENEVLREELEKERQRLDDKRREEAELAAMTEQRKQELKDQGEIIKNLLASAAMTKAQLEAYQKQENMIVPEDLIINTVTEMALSKSDYEMSHYVADCPIVKDETFSYTSDEIAEYIGAKKDARISGTAHCKVFKVEGNTFAMFYPSSESGGKMRVTLKCGPTYGSKLETVYTAGAVTKAKFPYGLLWYTVDETASLEMVKLLVTISYTIATLGY